MDYLNSLIPSPIASSAPPRPRLEDTAPVSNVDGSSRYTGWPEQAIRSFEKLCANATRGRQLTCGVCFEPYTDPVMVPECQHTFCRQCIKSVVEHNDKRCPCCRGPLPPIKDIPPNRTAAQQLDIAAREIIRKFHITIPETPGPAPVPLQEEVDSHDDEGEENEEEASIGEDTLLKDVEGPELDLRRFPQAHEIRDLPQFEVIQSNHSLVRVINLANLRVLNMLEVPQPLTEIAELPKLEELRCRQFILGASRLPSSPLRILEFKRAPGITRLESLEHLEELYGWPELESVSHMPRLRHFEVTDAGIKTLSDLPELRTLQIQKTAWEATYERKSGKARAGNCGLIALGVLCVPWCGCLCCIAGCMGIVKSNKGLIKHQLHIPPIALGRLPSLEKLSLLGMKSTGTLSRFPALKELELGIPPSNPPPASLDLIPRSDLAAMLTVKQEITASAVSVDMGTLPELRSLTLRGVKASRLSRMPKLETLITHGVRYSVGGLEDPNGISLALDVRADTAHVQTEIDSIQSLPSLTSLQMEGTRLKGMENLPMLTDLAGFSSVSVIKGIGVTELDLQQNYARTREVRDCPHLRKLVAHTTLEKVTNLPELETLTGNVSPSLKVVNCPKLN